MKSCLGRFSQRWLRLVVQRAPARALRRVALRRRLELERLGLLEQVPQVPQVLVWQVPERAVWLELGAQRAVRLALRVEQWVAVSRARHLP